MDISGRYLLLLHMNELQRWSPDNGRCDSNLRAG